MLGYRKGAHFGTLLDSSSQNSFLSQNPSSKHKMQKNKGSLDIFKILFVELTIDSIKVLFVGVSIDSIKVLFVEIYIDSINVLFVELTIDSIYIESIKI